jgi:HSP20 family protein
MTVLRIDPFRREFDRPTDQVRGRSRPVPPMDAYRRADEVVVQFDLPGVDPASIDVTVERGLLTVSGDRRPFEAAGGEVVVRERPAGRFTRQVRLADALDVSRVQADYELGVLTVTLPRREETRPRRVEVAHTVGAERPVVEAGTPDAGPATAVDGAADADSAAA